MLLLLTPKYIIIMVITVTNEIIEGTPISKLKLNICLIHKSQTIIDHATKQYLAIERTLSYVSKIGKISFQVTFEASL